jgi:hypothetical protein
MHIVKCTMLTQYSCKGQGNFYHEAWCTESQGKQKKKKKTK